MATAHGAWADWYQHGRGPVGRQAPPGDSAPRQLVGSAAARLLRLGTMDRKVYTRTGDDGTTALFYGGRVPKDAPGPRAYGAVDEAVSALGLARAETEPGSELAELLVRLQRELFVVGAELATQPSNRHKLEDGSTRVSAAMVDALEPVIDDFTARYEPPREFVLPGETRLAAALDVARGVVRRAERETVRAADEGWIGDEEESVVVAYLNRLADLVYTLARFAEGTYRPVRTDP